MSDPDDIHASQPVDSNPHVDKKFRNFALVFFLSIVASIILLAAREDSAPELQDYFDLAIFGCLSGLAIYLIARLFLSHRFGTLDLIAIISLLSYGLKTTIESLRDASLLLSKKEPRFSSTIIACMVAASFMILGASKGLRHCRVLRIEHPIKRVLTILCGMLMIPSYIGVIALPLTLIFIRTDFGEGAATALWLTLMWFFWMVVMSVNVVLGLKTLGRENKMR